MQNRGRIGDAAPYVMLVFGLLVVAVLAYSDGYMGASQEASSNQRLAERAQQAREACSLSLDVPSALDCVDRIKEQDINSQDLRAQQEMAIWAGRTFLAGILGLAVTIAGTALIVWQVYLARRSLDASAAATGEMIKQTRIMEDGQRARISIQPGDLRLRVLSDAIQVEHTITFHNSGGGAADTVHYMAAPWPSPIDNDDDIEVWRTIWRDVEDKKQVDHCLQPGEPFSHTDCSTFAFTELHWSTDDPRRFRLKFHTAVFYNTAGYRDETDRRKSYRSYSLGLQLTGSDRSDAIYECDLVQTEEGHNLILKPIGQNRDEPPRR